MLTTVQIDVTAELEGEGPDGLYSHSTCNMNERS